MATGSPQPVRYLTFGDIETIALELAVALFGKAQPIPRLQMLGGQAGADVLKGILALPAQSVGGKPAYQTIFDKAAVLLRSIALDHPFLDGNKRMALATALVFLSVNGWLIVASDEELVDFALNVAIGRGRDLAAIASWLESKAVPL